MKKFLLLHFALLMVHYACGQNPLVKMWDKRFGGSDGDALYSIQQTSDGGYILGGYSSSMISGDKTQDSRGGWDYWIVKIDSFGNIQWDKDFGGSDDDRLFSIQQTADSGYILGGYSLSNISGDKTQNSWGLIDYWIVKTDSLGNKQWDKDFGGTDEDVLFSISQAIDGGYILGGYSYSGISGDKTQNSWGLTDYWIVKTDSLGNKEWDKDFGGILVDVLYSIQQTDDDGYILCGYSKSPTSGDKTQDSWGDFDYWIIKIDSLGNKKWDKDFGGINLDMPYSIQQTFNGGYILGGYSASPISGNKTQNTWNNGLDFWIVKTDSLGNQQWDKDYGGTSADELYKISITSDGGFLLSGDSYSQISGDKTENNLGQEQTWVVKTDSLGNKIWDKTILTTDHDETGFAIETKDGCYLMANTTFAGIGGDKTQASWGSIDYWLIKFCETIRAYLTSATHFCPGTCVNFTNLSFNAASYQWNFFGASPDTSTATNPTNICYTNPGTYDVLLIASNANGSDTLLLTNYITVYPSPPAQSITQSGDTLSAITGAASYQWYFNGNIINSATNYFYVATQSGDYNVVATDSNGCEVEAVINDVLAHTPLATGFLPLAIYPNPVNDEFTIQNLKVTRGTAVEISIYNVLGEIVLTIPLPIANCQLPTCSIDVSALPKGTYMLELSVENHIYRSKFIKNLNH